MTWVVVSGAALRNFRETNVNPEVLVAVEAWAILTQLEGPPFVGRADVARGTWTADLPGLPVRAEYLVLPLHEPPVIVVRRFTYYRHLFS